MKREEEEEEEKEEERKKGREKKRSQGMRADWRAGGVGRAAGLGIYK